MEMERNTLHGLSFAIILLRAKHVGGSVLHCYLEHLHSISFNIDLVIMNQQQINYYFLVRIRYTSLKGSNLPYKARPGPIFTKSYVIIGRFDQKNSIT